MELQVRGRGAYASTGGSPFDPTRPVVVLIHGAGMDHTAWSLQARSLAHHRRAVLAVDLPGHGRAPPPPLGRIEDLADWLEGLLDAAGVETAALVGHSMGALVALHMAARLPVRVRALALLGAATRMPVHPDLLRAARAGEAAAIAMIIGWGFGPRGQLGGNPAPGQWMMGGGVRLLERAGPGVLAADLAACDAYAEGTAAAAKVACPTLVIIGQADRMTPAKAGHALAKEIAGASAIVLPGVGHMMMAEAPNAISDALIGFV
jgi:pimeloyl-ACP methyl ester carboxylesterase